jgi:magnesium transporter
LISLSENEIQKRFAGWAAILAVPTMIAGIYGMNFKFMPELDWVYGYPMILAATVLLCTLMYRAFRRAGWL